VAPVGLGIGPMRRLRRTRVPPPVQVSRPVPRRMSSVTPDSRCEKRCRSGDNCDGGVSGDRSGDPCRNVVVHIAYH